MCFIYQNKCFICQMCSIFQNFKNELYAEICTRINMPLYTNLNMHKYAKNMQKYAKICSEPISISPIHSYAFICTKYAKICKICKHECWPAPIPAWPASPARPSRPTPAQRSCTCDRMVMSYGPNNLFSEGKIPQIRGENPVSSLCV